MIRAKMGIGPHVLKIFFGLPEHAAWAKMALKSGYAPDVGQDLHIEGETCGTMIWVRDPLRIDIVVHELVHGMLNSFDAIGVGYRDQETLAYTLGSLVKQVTEGQKRLAKKARA